MSFYNIIISAWQALFLSVVALFMTLAGAFNAKVSYVPTPAPMQTATTSALVATTTTAATQKTKAKPAATASSTSPAKTAQPQTPAVSAPPPVFTNASGQAANLAARAAVVNILCTTGGGGYFNPISGSGVIIDTRGIVLTNAHVAQFLLLRDYGGPDNVDCAVRTGNPATPTYRAEILYLPPAWITANASKINAADPTGTGENDYAFLLITATAAPGGTLPSSFPTLPLTLTEPTEGEEMLLASYPAGLLGGTTIQQNLYQSSAFATVDQLYAYSNLQHVDLFSLSGSVVSQSGSSGGAAVDPSGSLSGVIATAAIGTTTARSLNAITLSHVDRSLKSAGLGGLQAFLSQQNLKQAAADFNANTAPQETAALEAYLPK